eukprot:5353846-Amphidinium_carterae.1
MNTRSAVLQVHEVLDDVSHTFEQVMKPHLEGARERSLKQTLEYGVGANFKCYRALSDAMPERRPDKTIQFPSVVVSPCGMRESSTHSQDWLRGQDTLCASSADAC